MKNLFLIAVLLLTNQLIAQVTVTVHHYDYFNTSNNFKNIRSTVSVFARKPLGPKLAVTSFSLVNKKWGESLVGLEYSPFKWLSIEGEVGIESNIEYYGYKKNVIRRAEIITVATNKFLFLGTFEQGSMPWFDLRSFYLVIQFGLGVMGSQYYGVGPVVQYHIGKSPFTIWASSIYDWETYDYGSMVGIYFKMK